MPEPPSNSGPLGFLFTDIEGSTRLWETFPRAMPRAQTLHDALLRQWIEAHGGELYRSAGDAVQAVFPDGSSALRAAIDAQRALGEVDWAIPDGLRVRMALHVTRAERTQSNDYRSPQLSRLQANLSLAYGGQILLTSAAADAVRHQRPEDVSLIDLGHWQLVGIGQSEPIFQVAHPKLPSEFPPFEAPIANRFTLEAHSDRFVGRSRELDELLALIHQPEVRLITLTGPGGIGKTRLAQQLAIELQETTATPIWFVELVGLVDPSQVLSAIASAMNVPEIGHAGAFDALASALREREIVLMLDNFEHVLPAADEIARILTHLPKLRVIATSRGPLQIRGEWQYPLGALSLPSALTRSWDELDAAESVQLFADRAAAANPGFTLGNRNVTAVVDICRKLEGLPLAIELAAPLVRVLSIDELSERLNDQLGLVADEDAEREGRHRAIRASIAWSYDLLDPETRQFFRQLGPLQSGFTLETLDGLLGGQFDALTQVERLVAQNLVHRGRFQGDPDRLALLESVRQFALEQLIAAGELTAACERHARYFSALAVDRYPDQRDYDALAVALLSPEIGDLRLAILWLAEHDSEWALRLGAGVWRLWFVVGRLADADQWLHILNDATEDVRSVDRVRALNGWAIVQHAMAQFESSIQLDLQSLQLAEELGDARGIGDALNHMTAPVMLMTGNIDEASLLVERALDAYLRIDDRHGEAEALLDRAVLAFEQGRFEESLADGQRVLEYCRAEGKDVLASNTIHGVAGIAICAGKPDLARELLVEGLELSRRLGYDVFLSANISVLTTLLIGNGWYEDALRLAEFARSFNLDVAPGGDLSDPFQRIESERVEMLANLPSDTAERALAEGKRLTAEDAVRQSLQLLQGLGLSDQS